MKKHELENNRENSSSVSKKAAERQAHEHASQESSASDPAPRIRTTALPDETISPQTHATILNRAKAGGASQTNQVLRQLQRQYGNHYVQRVVDLARKDEEEREVAPEVEQAIQSKRGSGQDLDKGVRTQMESAFGADFSGVRVHTDGEADTLNRHLNARAFTTGQDVFFREGGYNPGSSSGRELLAHELTHVVQQTDSLHKKMTLGQPSDKYEQEADEVGRVVSQREQQAVIPHPVQRQTEKKGEEPLSIPPEMKREYVVKVPFYRVTPYSGLKKATYRFADVKMSPGQKIGNITFMTMGPSYTVWVKFKSSNIKSWTLDQFQSQIIVECETDENVLKRLKKMTVVKDYEQPAAMSKDNPKYIKVLELIDKGDFKEFIQYVDTLEKEERRTIGLNKEIKQRIKASKISLKGMVKAALDIQ
jgi:uncharacterized protein DUF4157